MSPDATSTWAETASADPLAGSRVTVMGLGRFGGGIGVVRFLQQVGARITLTDLATADQLAESLARIDTQALQALVLGEHRERDFTDADLVVVNPAVKPQGNRFVDAARAAGVPLATEMSLFLDRFPGSLIGVTGSVGKSTTATLIQHVLAATGHPVHLAGNIGVSLLPEVGTLTARDRVVLELSSFQLSGLEPRLPRADVAVVTNFFPNHLDWHPDLDDYRRAKQVLLGRQQPGQFAVLNADDPDVRTWPTAARKVWFGTNIPSDAPGVRVCAEGLVACLQGEQALPDAALPMSLRSLPGKMNLAAAWAAAWGAMQRETAKAETSPAPRDASLADSIRESIKTFQPLPHRMQPLGDYAGRTFINDSKATTPEAAMAALRAAAEQGPVVLIAGGKDKGVDLASFASAMKEHCRAVVLIGQTASTLEQQLTELYAESPTQRGLLIERATSVEGAVRVAFEKSRTGDVILLSPGCASDGECLNYEDRGRRFGEAARGCDGDG